MVANLLGARRKPAGAPHQTHHDHHDHTVNQRSNASGRNEPMDAAPSSESVRNEVQVHGSNSNSLPRAICIAVDDYGLHPGINQAALLLAAAGRAQAIGCMVGGAAWSQWSRELVELDRDRWQVGGVDLGLHLDLTETPGGSFAARPLWRLIFDCWSGRIDRPPLRAEIRRQLDAFEQALGRPPDYVDGHQHVHQFPVVRDELIEELCRRHGSNRPWLRSTIRPASIPGTSFRLKSHLIEALGGHKMAGAAQQKGLSCNHTLLGVHAFSADAETYAAYLRGWLAQAGTADLLMCHPSLFFNGHDPIIKARLAEFEVLSGAGFERWLIDAGIVLRSMSRMLEAGPVMGWR